MATLPPAILMDAVVVAGRTGESRIEAGRAEDADFTDTGEPRIESPQPPLAAEERDSMMQLFRSIAGSNFFRKLFVFPEFSNSANCKHGSMS